MVRDFKAIVLSPAHFLVSVRILEFYSEVAAKATTTIMYYTMKLAIEC